MEWTCFVSVFPKCCNKCCGLTNCLKQKPRGLLQQIKSSISRIQRVGAHYQYWQSTRLILGTLASFESSGRNRLTKSGLLFAGREVWKCRVLWFVEISPECLKQQLACVNYFFEASLYQGSSPFFSCQCADTLVYAGGYLYWELSPLHQSPCVLTKSWKCRVSKKPPVDSNEPTLGKHNFPHRDLWKLTFSLKSLSVALESFLGQVPVNALSDELLLGFVKGHFHPSEHICIQSEARENMFHTNCLLFYCQG